MKYEVNGRELMKLNLRRQDHPLSFHHRPHRILIQVIPTFCSGGMNYHTHRSTHTHIHKNSLKGGGCCNRMLFERHILFFPFSQQATTLQVQHGDHPTALAPSFFPSSEIISLLHVNALYQQNT